MFKSEITLAQGENESGVEPEVRQKEELEMNRFISFVSHNNLDTKERIIYEDETFEEVPTADPEDYFDEILIKTHEKNLCVVNPKSEQYSNEHFKINPKQFQEEVQRTIRERDKVKVDPKIDQEKGGSKNMKSNQIQRPKVGVKTIKEGLPQRIQFGIELEKLLRKEQTENYLDGDPFKDSTKSLKSSSKQSAADSSKKPAEFYLLPKIINAGFAGMVGVSTVFPLDFVKTRLQTQVPGPDGQLPYKSIFDCFKKTIKTEGYFGMYRGSFVNIVLVTPEKAIKLAANDFFRFHLTRPNGELPIYRQMVAGGLAGLFQIIVTTPMELLKIRMQMSGQAIAKAKAAGQPIPHVTPFTILASLLKENGVLGLYKGITATMLRDVLFSIIYFPLFATLNSMGPRRPDGSGETEFWWSFASGAASGTVSAFSVTPADVIKTRLQNAKKVQGVAPEYLGIVDCFAKTISKEGVKALFKGGACRVMVVAPLFGIAQAFYYLGFAENVFGLKNK